MVLTPFLIGARLCETASDEDGIEHDGVYRGTNQLQPERIDVYFNEVGYREPEPLGSLFRLDDFFIGQSGASNNWAKGRTYFPAPRSFYRV